jgi:hypothetical protein
MAELLLIVGAAITLIVAPFLKDHPACKERRHHVPSHRKNKLR